MSSLKALVTGIVDYAGLFPPAALDMETVVSNYAEYLQSTDHWMLSRLIVPAARLAEFEQAAREKLPTETTAAPWKISALVPPVESSGDEFQYAISGIQQFNERHAAAEQGLALVDVIETKVAAEKHVQELAERLPPNLAAFLELPLDQLDLVEVISRQGDEFGRSRLFAKIRTGGVKQEWIPSTAEVAGFILACAEHFVPFKATAGLHHPIRGEFNLTYEPEAESGTMHGFVNVFVAACFAFSGVDDLAQIQAILESKSIDDFTFDQDGLAWSGCRVSRAKVAQIRRRFAVSFGSCSFLEPSTELQPTLAGR